MKEGDHVFFNLEGLRLVCPRPIREEGIQKDIQMKKKLSKKQSQHPYYYIGKWSPFLYLGSFSGTIAGVAVM